MRTYLASYFRTCRIKSGLTQEDMAFLLGLKSTTAISKIEKNEQRPSLIIVLAYSIIFGIEVEKLLPRLISDTKQLILNRAPSLVRDIQNQSRAILRKERISFLESLSSHQSSGHHEKHEKYTKKAFRTAFGN